MNKFREWITFSVISYLIAVTLVGCDKPEEQREEAPAREVDVLSVKTEPFTVFAELPGRIEPVRVAEVRARVAGIVLKRTFEEGADVKAGDVLARIDDRDYQVALLAAAPAVDEEYAWHLAARADQGADDGVVLDLQVDGLTLNGHVRESVHIC